MLRRENGIIQNDSFKLEETVKSVETNKENK